MDKEKVAKILSRNEVLHRYGETSGEFFANLVRDMVDNLSTGEVFEDVRRRYYVPVLE